MGLATASHVFFLLRDVAAWLTLWIFGISFMPFLLCAVLLGAVQAQAGSCSTTLGTRLQRPSMGLSGHHPIRPPEEGRVPVSPWNRMHLQHHAKPNCFHEDPDINTQHKCFLTGSGLCCLSALCGVFSVLLPSGMGAEDSAWMITFYVPILLVDMPCWEQKASWAFSSWSGS